jgi:hypothetical protein
MIGRLMIWLATAFFVGMMFWTLIREVLRRLSVSGTYG